MKFLLALPLALTLASCGGDAAKTDPKTGEKTVVQTDDAKPADAKPADAKPADAAGPLALPKLGLKGNAPAGATAGDAIGGGVGHMVQGTGLVAIVEVASETRAKTVEAAKKDAEMYTPKNLKDEKLADGWAISYDNEGGMGKNYFVNVRREIDGKSIWCETTAPTPEQAATALEFCKSLSK